MTDPAVVLFEVAGHEDVGPPVSGRPVLARPAVLALLPAAVLVGLLVVVPFVVTAATSLVADAGPGNYGVLGDPRARHALGNSLRWLLLAPAVCVVAVLLAQVGRRSSRMRGVLLLALVAPMAVSMLVTGFSFRLLFDPEPTRGPVTALATGVHDLVSHPAPLPGGRPEPLSAGAVPPSPGGRVDGPVRLTDDPDGSGDLVTAATVSAGSWAELAVLGVTGRPVSPSTPDRTSPVVPPTEIRGRVLANGTPAARVPVAAVRAGEVVARATTGPDGAFRLGLAGQPAGGGARYALRIPAAAVAPRWVGPDFLGPVWIGRVLALAFGWAWTGFAVVLCRAALDGVPRDLLRMARAHGAGRIRTLRTVVLPALVPALGVVVLTLLVAAARVFELVYVGAPGATQSDADVVSTHWLRERAILGDGRSAALAMLLVLLVTVPALVVVRGLGRGWPRGPDAADRSGFTPAVGAGGTDGSRLLRVLRRAVASLVVGLWLMPFLLLLLTSLRHPDDAAVAGFWVPGRHPWGLQSYAELLRTTPLPGALWQTAVRATASAILVSAVAVPAAYALTHGGLPRRASGGLVAGTAALAVMPVQAVAAPLNTAFATLRLVGAPTALLLVHVAFGVPFAVLLVRAAFAAVPAADIAVTGPGMAGATSVIGSLLQRCWPTVLAAAVLEFVLVWNDLLVGLLLGGPGTSVATLVLLGQARQFGTSAGVLAAGAVITMVVPLAVVLGTSRWLVRGLAVGVPGGGVPAGVVPGGGVPGGGVPGGEHR